MSRETYSTHRHLSTCEVRKPFRLSVDETRTLHTNNDVAPIMIPHQLRWIQTLYNESKTSQSFRNLVIQHLIATCASEPFPLCVGTS